MAAWLVGAVEGDGVLELKSIIPVCPLVWVVSVVLIGFGCVLYDKEPLGPIRRLVDDEVDIWFARGRHF